MFVQLSRRTILFTAPRSAVALRSFSLGDKLHDKEKHEEDRYMREQEKAFFAKKAAQQNAELTEFESVVAPAMLEAELLLKKTGDKISEAGLEAIANWKLNAGKK